MARKKKSDPHSPNRVKNFFSQSDYLDRMTLRPLSHIAPYWEATWNDDTKEYNVEPRSFSRELNKVIDDISHTPRPTNYHAHEDAIIEDIKNKWNFQKVKGRWQVLDYGYLLEQSSFWDVGQKHLLSAATGRVHAALDFEQAHFDEMEQDHLNILAGIITIIIYRRYCVDESILDECEERTSD